MKNSDFILEELLTSIVIGMPKAAIVCSDMNNRSYYFSKISEWEKYFTFMNMVFCAFHSDDGFCCFVIEGSIIVLIFEKDADDFMTDHPEYGMFWDSYAEEKYNNRRVQERAKGQDPSLEPSHLGV